MKPVTYGKAKVIVRWRHEAGKTDNLSICNESIMERIINRYKNNQTWRGGVSWCGKEEKTDTSAN